MIYLKRDRELVRVANWEDIESLPGYSTTVSSADKLKEIIGYYDITPFQPCGFTDCHTPHGKGFIILCEDGRVTKIGGHCGKKFLNVDFAALERDFKRAIEDFENRDALRSFKQQLPNVRDRIVSLVDSAKPLNRTLTALQNAASGFPEPIRRALSAMCRLGDGAITRERQLTGRELEAARAAQPGRSPSPFVTETIGRLSGFQAWCSFGRVREVLFDELQGLTDAIDAADIESMNGRDLRHWATEAGKTEARFAEVSEQLAYARALLSEANLSQLARLIENEPQAEKNRFSKLVREITRA